jgi:hypothetical protein
MAPDNPCFLRRQVYNQRAIGPRAANVTGEVFETRSRYRVVIRKENHGRTDRLAPACSPVEDLLQRSAGFESALGRTLDHGAIRQGSERHSGSMISAPPRSMAVRLSRGIKRRITGGQVNRRPCSPRASNRETAFQFEMWAVST